MLGTRLSGLDFRGRKGKGLAAMEVRKVVTKWNNKEREGILAEDGSREGFGRGLTRLDDGKGGNMDQKGGYGMNKQEKDEHGMKIWIKEGKNV